MLISTKLSTTPEVILFLYISTFICNEQFLGNLSQESVLLIDIIFFEDYVDGKHITEIGAVGGCDVDMVEDMVTIMKRQNLLVDGDCLRLGTDIGKGKSNLFNFFLIKRQRATPNIYFFYISKFVSMIENLIV